MFLLAAGLFVLVYQIVLSFPGGDSDYIDHLIWTLGMTWRDCLESLYDGSERLWHICVKCIMCLNSNMWKAAAIVTASADTASYILLFAFFDECLPRKFSRPILAVVTAAAFISSALYVPVLAPGFYVSKGAINTWHNPTSIMVRPFAIAVFYMTVRMYNRYRYATGTVALYGQVSRSDFDLTQNDFWYLFKDRVYKPHEIILYPLCILLSTYAKPSFLQFFAPAILAFLLIDMFRTKGKLLPFCLKLALAYIPAIVIMLMQFTSFFHGGISAGAEAAASTGSGVAVYFLQPSFAGISEFFSTVGTVILRLLWLCAWPLFVLFLDAGSYWGSAGGRLSCLCLAAGELESMLLHETGPRAEHGNFLWGFYTAVWIFWCAAVERFIAILQMGGKKRAAALWVGCPLLAWHVASGILYVTKIIQTGLYLY